MSDHLDKVLSGIEKVNKVISIGLPGVSGIVSLITGAVVGIKKLRENADGSVEYEFVIRSGHQEIADARANAGSALSVVNEELIRLGEVPIDE